MLSGPNTKKIEQIFAESKHIGQNEVALFAIFDRNTKEASFVTHGPITTSNVLRLGSITKIFLAYVALKAGLPLEKTVAEIMPELAGPSYAGSDRITFRQLLNHTAGIVNYSKLPGAQDFAGEYNPAVTVDLGWKDRPLLFEPGTQWHYSNTNSEVVAMAVEKISGKKIKALIDEACGEIAPTLTLDTGAAQPYPLEAPGYANFKMPWSFPSASGRLIGTPLDALRAIDTISTTNEWKLMQSWATAPKRTPDPGYDPAGGDKYGFYLQEFDFGATKAIGHDGHIHVTSVIATTDDRVFLIHTSSDVDTCDWMPLSKQIISAALEK